MVRARKNFHLPLPEALYDELHGVAAAHDKPATRLAVELVEQGLAELRRRERSRQIATYAAAMAGASEDLDAALEAAGLDSIRDATR